MNGDGLVVCLFVS